MSKVKQLINHLDLLREFLFSYIKKITFQLSRYPKQTIYEIGTNFYAKIKRNIDFFNGLDDIFILKKKINYLINFEDSLKYTKENFIDVKFFTFFLNNARSGHSLVGAILDAHPNIVISHEVDVLPLLKYHGFDFVKIYSRILSNSYKLSKAINRFETGYNYNISYQYAGRYKILKVIGDKKGGGSCRYLDRDPKYIYKLLKIFGKKLKIISVFRNPYDNIVALSKRNNIPIKIATNIYFKRVETFQKIKNIIPEDQVLIITHESLINDSNDTITKLCHFFELDVPNDYLNACNKILFKNPRARRYEIKWNEKDFNYIEKLINKEKNLEFFKDYKF